MLLISVVALFACSIATALSTSAPEAVTYASVGGSPYKVTYDNRAVQINGERVLLQSGSVHYPRMPPEMWSGILAQCRALGLNMIETYVMWNWHESVQGEVDFKSYGRDLAAFISQAGKQGLFVFLRIGPYVCAEWNFGGLPVWLKDIPGIVFREDNPAWMSALTTFVNVVLAEVQPQLATNGGPIIMLQIENEFGDWESSYPNAAAYVVAVTQYVRSLDIGVPWVMCQQADAPQDIINTCNSLSVYHAMRWCGVC